MSEIPEQPLTEEGQPIDPFMGGYYITIEQAAEMLGLRHTGVHAAVFRGQLHPVRKGRRSLFPRHEVEAYREEVQGRVYDSKAEAQAFYERYPQRPATDPPITERHWDIFVAYAAPDSEESYTTLGDALKITRERVRQIVATVTSRLADYDAAQQDAEDA